MGLGSAVLVAAFCSASEAAPPTLGERYEELVAEISAAQAGLRTLEATFFQRKQSELLLEPEESRGNFLYQKPDRVRWDFAPPSDTVVVVRDQQMTTWFRELDRAERVDLGRHGDRILQFFGPSSSLETLKRYFTTSVTFPTADGSPYVLELTPSFSRMKKRIRSMTLHVDPELLVPVFVRFVEPGGNSTEITFEDIEVNQEIPEHRFELELPLGVEITSLRESG